MARRAATTTSKFIGDDCESDLRVNLSAPDKRGFIKTVFAGDIARGRLILKIECVPSAKKKAGVPASSGRAKKGGSPAR